jgi:SAM-dependent methyltransferase
MSMRGIRLVNEVANLDYNRYIYGDLSGMKPEQHDARFGNWWHWAETHGLNAPEYLLPQLHVPTQITPFTFEQRFADSFGIAPTRDEIDAAGPWAYQVEFGDISTLSRRMDADWTYHRYRKSLLVDTATTICGQLAGELSVLDVAAHCGVFSLEFATKGFADVLGIDLRENNIRQAEFLRKTFDVPHVSFMERNVWDIGDFKPRDVVFCGGLMYHVTYPMKLLQQLHDLTTEFLVFDTLTHKYPFSGFHLVCNKDVNYSAEGEFHYELHPTYRAICDGLQAVGFRHIYELIGDNASGVPNYDSGNVRSFIAAKSDSPRELLASFVSAQPGSGGYLRNFG